MAKNLMRRNRKRELSIILLGMLPVAAQAQQPSSTHVPAIVLAQASNGAGAGQSGAQATQVPAALQAQAQAAATQGQDAARASADSAASFGPSEMTATTSSKQPAVPLTMPPPIRLVSPSAPLSPKERRGTALARRWRNRAEYPQPGEDGVVRYLYGATMASVVCAPLMVCDLALQPGEVVQALNIGDSVRWRITPAFSGMGENRTTHVIIKPVDAGLVTDMVLSTQKRIYSVKLVSTAREWMPLVAFNYPDDVQSQWANYQQATGATGAASTLATGENFSNLDFNYRITGDDPVWKPVRVYNDGAKTYIEFSSAVAHQASPVLVALANDGNWFSAATPQFINYRSMGNRYIVDSVLSKAALISGVGDDQIKVSITRGAP